jgi:hypothetical protein
VYGPSFFYFGALPFWVLDWSIVHGGVVAEFLARWYVCASVPVEGAGRLGRAIGFKEKQQHFSSRRNWTEIFEDEKTNLKVETLSGQ